MYTIWKQTLELKKEQIIEIPFDSKFLVAKLQNNQITIWFHCYSENKLEERTILIYGTGHEVLKESEMDYLGTIIQDSFIWHIFEKFYL